MKDQLSRLEGHLEKLVEGSLARLLGEGLSASGVAGQLARAMSDGVRKEPGGRSFAPNQFALTLNPQAAQELLEQAPDIQGQLADGLVRAAKRSGYELSEEPHITLAADPTLGRFEVRVISWHSSSPLEFTQSMSKEQGTTPGKIPGGAFLILDNGQHFPLDRPVINIGRRIDNQIVLEDQHVSRTHAQLRVRDGRFVLFDLGSTGGTKVNGRKVKQHILRPGDVITIASMRMVYGEDPGGPPDTSTAYMPPFPPRPAGDQRTVTGGFDRKEGK